MYLIIEAKTFANAQVLHANVGYVYNLSESHVMQCHAEEGRRGGGGGQGRWKITPAFRMLIGDGGNIRPHLTHLWGGVS